MLLFFFFNYRVLQDPCNYLELLFFLIVKSFKFLLRYFQLYNKVNLLYIYIYALLFRFFSHIGYYRVLRAIKCYTIDPYQLSLLYIVVCMLFPAFQFIPPNPLPVDNRKFIFYICTSISVL